MWNGNRYRPGYFQQQTFGGKFKTFARNKVKYFTDVKDAEISLLKSHQARVARIESELPPIAIPQILTIDEIKYPIIARRVFNGLRVQKYKGLFFDEDGNYIDMKNIECEFDESFCMHSWGIVRYINRNYDSDRMRIEIANPKNFIYDKIEYIPCEYVDYKLMYSSENYSLMIRSKKDLIRLISKDNNIAGVYLFKIGGHYEMGYRGHQSESLYYLDTVPR